MLHEMPAGIVGYHCMRDPMLAELPGGKRSALIARTGLVHPHVEQEACVMGDIDRGKGSAEINRSKPTGIAVSEHLNRRARLLLCGNFGYQLGPMTADRLIDGDVLLADLTGTSISVG